MHDPYEDQLAAARYRAERDQARQELGRLKDRSRDTTVSAYDLLPEEDREALRWVREHGGLERVKNLLNWVLGHCSTKQQLDFDFWLSGRVMYELGFEEDMADRDEVERRLLARLMPEGMEWPRFEDGARVKFGDVVSDGDETGRVYYVTFDAVNPVIIGFTDETPDQDPGTWLEVSVSDGERVKRPAPKVLDPKVLDADWVEIRVGDTVCGTRDMEPMRVVDTDSRECGFKRIKCEKEGEGFFFYCADELTHKLPILAADGKPLREGETVWNVDGIGPYEVSSIDGNLVKMVSGACINRCNLTHERPVADTWERLEEDARNIRTAILDSDKLPFEVIDERALNIVRRARALAERGA